MKIVKFASIVMGPEYHPDTDTAALSNAYNNATFFGVSSIEEACALAERLRQEGYECIELCGAFGEDGARAVIKSTQNQIAVGYSVHFPEQDSIFDKVFS